MKRLIFRALVCIWQLPQNTDPLELSVLLAADQPTEPSNISVHLAANSFD